MIADGVLCQTDNYLIYTYFSGKKQTGYNFKKKDDKFDFKAIHVSNVQRPSLVASDYIIDLNIHVATCNTAITIIMYK